MGNLIFLFLFCHALDSITRSAIKHRPHSLPSWKSCADLVPARAEGDAGFGSGNHVFKIAICDLKTQPRTGGRSVLRISPPPRPFTRARARRGDGLLRRSRRRAGTVPAGSAFPCSSRSERESEEKRERANHAGIGECSEAGRHSMSPPLRAPYADGEDHSHRHQSRQQPRPSVAQEWKRQANHRHHAHRHPDVHHGMDRQHGNETHD